MLLLLMSILILLLLMLLFMLIMLLLLPLMQLRQLPIKNIGALEAPIVLAKDLHKDIVLLALAIVSF
jgi:hypothetical protein